MKMITAIILNLVFTGSLIASESGENPFSFVIKVGEEYNSNLTIEELDIDSNESGFLTNIEFIADINQNLDDSSSLRFGYEFSQSLHEELSEFNTQNNGFTAAYEKEHGKFIYSADYIYYDTKLDDSALMNMHFFIPAVSYMLNDNILIRADYTNIEKEFDEYTERSATSRGAGLSGFYFFNDAKSYFRFAVNGDEEDAVSDELDYASTSFAVSMKTPAEWISRGASFKASASFSERDYDHITLEIEDVRAEEKTQFKTSLIIPYGDHLKFIGAYEYIDRVSNLDIANYDENRANISVEFKF